MNRAQFEKILDSTTICEGMKKDNVQRSVAPLTDALRQLMPERLFKYRSCCENHIKAFCEDKVYLATSDLYNDPFDTLIQYDVDAILRIFGFLKNTEVQKAIAQYIIDGGAIPEEISKIISEKEKSELRQKAGQIVRNKVYINRETELCNSDFELVFAFVTVLIPLLIQHLSISACFSESISSLLMWSHYSDCHKGFALGYDLTSFLYPNTEGLMIFPVVYNDKKFDATQYIMYLMGNLVQVPFKNIDTLAQIKVLLHKAKEWEYEKEWRLMKHNTENVTYEHVKSYVIRPNSIYYGCRFSIDDMQKLHIIAKDKNLQEFKMKLDNAANTYEVSAHPIE